MVVKVTKTVVDELKEAENAYRDLPIFETALAVNAVFGAVLDGVDEVCDVPFVKVALGIVNVLRAHVQNVTKADKYVVEARRRAEAMQETVERLAKAKFPRSNQRFAEILKTLTDLMKVGLSSG